MSLGYEALYVAWVNSVTKNQALAAGTLSALVVSLSLLSAFWIVQDYITIIPAALGHGLGSYLEVRRNREAAIRRAAS